MGFGLTFSKNGALIFFGAAALSLILSSAQAAPGRSQSIPQTGKTADEINQTLARIKLPKGFRIELYAIVPEARHMAVSPNAKVVMVGTRRDRVYTVSDLGNQSARTVTAFAPAVTFDLPNGVCFAPDGNLYIAEKNRVQAFPTVEERYADAAIKAETVLAQGKLIPPSETSDNHAARVCRVGPDNRLYITLGQPYNVPPASKIALYDKVGMGGIIRIDRDGGNREVYATGARNSVGLDFNPANRELWWTDNQVDGMGDDIPPGELNRQTAAGQNFGFPWYGGGSVRTREYKSQTPPGGIVFPAVEMAAHAADLGMTFYSGTMFPNEYKGGIFIAEHGSWDRSSKIGARVMFTAIKPDGSAGETRVFAEGWIDAPNDQYLGRPVDVAPLPDGSILVSDDFAGAIYRISYGS